MLNRVSNLVLIAVLVIGFALRVWGNNFGLPYEYHVDEVQYVRQAASMGEHGLQPTWWNNPPFLKYILLAEYAGLYAVGKTTQVYSSAEDFGRRSTADPTNLYMLGRLTSAFFGVLTVLVVYLLGKSIASKRVGLIAAWFLTVCFLHVRDSHYAVNDVAATFFVTTALFAAIKLVSSYGYKWYIIGGAALGLGFATKYTALFASLPLLLAHVSTAHHHLTSRESIRKLFVLMIVTIAAGIIGSPYFVLVPHIVIGDVYEALILAGRNGFDGWEIDPAGGYLFYLKSLLWGLGWGLFFLTLIGIGMAGVRRRMPDLIIVSLPLIMYIVLGQSQLFFARFILPIVPALTLLGAASLDWLMDHFIQTSRLKISSLVLTTFILTAQPIMADVRYDYLLMQPDTRTLAKKWIEANIAEGSSIAVDWTTYAPPLATIETPRPESTSTYRVLAIGGAGLAEHTLEWYQEQQFDYLISSSFIYQIPLANQLRNARRNAFYCELDQKLELIYLISPTLESADISFIFDEIYGPAISLWQRDRPGPTLRIYSLQFSSNHGANHSTSGSMDMCH